MKAPRIILSRLKLTFHAQSFQGGIIIGNYIAFEKSEIEQANNVPIETVLLRHGIQPKRTGHELRWQEPGQFSISIHENKWYSHYEKVGGGTILFVQKYFGLSFQEAVQTLLGKSQAVSAPTVMSEQNVQKRKDAAQSFVLPPAYKNNDKVIKYLTENRKLAPEIVQHFIDEGMLYESAEPYKDRTIHNLVIVGKDGAGVSQQAHIKSISRNSTFRRNAVGSNPKYGFAHIGTSERLHIFEAAVDMMAYITLHQEGWQADSYVALDGISAHALFTVLDEHPNLSEVILSLDHDPAGQMGTVRLMLKLLPRKLHVCAVMPEEVKDWDEQLLRAAGQPYMPASEHPILRHIPQYAAALFEAMQDKHLQDTPIERIQLAIKQFADAYCDGDGTSKETAALQKGALSAAVLAKNTLRQVGREIGREGFVLRLCAAADWIVPKKGKYKYRDELFRDADRLVRQAREMPAKTEEQKLDEAQAFLTLAGKCTALQISKEIELAQNQSEANPCEMQFR